MAEAQKLLDELFKEVLCLGDNHENTLEKSKTIIRLLGIVGDRTKDDEDRLGAALDVELFILEEFELYYFRAAEDQQIEINEQLLQCLEKNMSPTLKERVYEIISNVIKKIVTKMGLAGFPELPEFLLSAMEKDTYIKTMACNMLIGVWHLLIGKADEYLTDFIDGIQRYLNNSEDVVNILGVKLLFHFVKLYEVDSNPLLKDPLHDAIMTIEVIIRNAEKREDLLPLLEMLKEVAKATPKYLEFEAVNIFNLCVIILKDENSFITEIKTAVHIMSLLLLPDRHETRLYCDAVSEILVEMTNVEPNLLDSSGERIEDIKREDIVQHLPLYHLTSVLEEAFIFSITIRQIENFLASDDWKKQVAAFNAISAISEFCWYYLDVNMNRFINDIRKGVYHDVPYVRYAACLAVSNLSKHCQLIFTQEFHDKIIEDLLPKPQDTWRVETMALNALCNYIKHSPRNSVVFKKDSICEILKNNLTKLCNAPNANPITNIHQHHLYALVSAISVFYDCLGFDAFYKDVKDVVTILMGIIAAPEAPTYPDLLCKCIHCVSTIVFNVKESTRQTYFDINKIMSTFVTTHRKIPEDPEQLLSLLDSWRMFHIMLDKEFMTYFHYPLVKKVIQFALSSKPKKMFPLVKEKLSIVMHNPNCYAYATTSQTYVVKSQDCEHIVLAHELMNSFIHEYPDQVLACIPIKKIYRPMCDSLYSNNIQIRKWAVSILKWLPKFEKNEEIRKVLSEQITSKIRKDEIRGRDVFFMYQI